MEVYEFEKYDMDDLYEKALADGAIQKDINTLGAWLDKYNHTGEYPHFTWDGESYHLLDDGRWITPVMEEDEDGYFHAIRYDLH